MSFSDLETSQQLSRPVELFDIVTPSTTYHLTSAQANVTYNGNLYLAECTCRSTIVICDLLADQSDLELELAANHALVQQYVNGVPPSTVSVTCTRVFPTEGGAALLWWPTSYASSVTFSGRTATIRVPALTSDAMTLDVPSTQATRICNHVLYDAQCTIAKSSFQFSTTIGSIISGTVLALAATVPSPVSSVPWSLHGMILHVPSGETRTIIIEATDQKTLTLFTQFPNGLINVGDAVTIYAGCDHTLSTCTAKFSNANNFGGFPSLPPSNMFETGLTTIQPTAYQEI